MASEEAPLPNSNRMYSGDFKFDEAQRYFVGECYVNGKIHGRVGMDKCLSPAKDIFLH
jgi:hypothetical protein